MKNWILVEEELETVKAHRSRGRYHAKTFTTNDSRVVPHRSTELAHCRLVSQIGRDATISAGYERMMVTVSVDLPGVSSAVRVLAKGCGPLKHPLLIREAYGTAIPSLTAAVDFACSVSGLSQYSTT